MVMRKKKRKANPKLMAEKAHVLSIKVRRAAKQKPHGGYPTKRTPGIKMQAIKLKNQSRRRKRSGAPRVRK